MSWDAPIPSETLSQTLTRALGAAQIAVKLDADDQDTMAAVEAYQRSISLLEDVIRREPSEDEVTRLETIRATYRERIEVLLLCRSVPITQQSCNTLIGGKPRKFKGCNLRASRARRWTVERMKVLCGCTSDMRGEMYY
ncbi:hypothetical protein DFH07DRAFT_822717 [Mycena maculata]|uniref:MIT domain-containing protein n=1 Tax=Mycena maculata TaxID=230809 RepID=A0AAD7J3H3_9AGAR|nr:hypothetical protein DFH07DRAFT_822717 [Mycena maculata]